jgi:hypothetical protein
MGLTALLTLTTVLACGQAAKEKSRETHSHFTKIPAAVADIWKEIHKQQARLVSTVAKKDLGEAHDHAFAIRDLVKALPGKIAPENKTAAEAAAKEITKLAAEIDRSGAARAQKATEAGVKQMGEAVLALEAKLKPTGTSK